MKKILLSALMVFLSTGIGLCANSVFDSMDKAVEVKLAPAIKTAANTQTATQTTKSAGCT